MRGSRPPKDGMTVSRARELRTECGQAKRSRTYHKTVTEQCHGDKDDVLGDVQRVVELRVVFLRATLRSTVVDEANDRSMHVK